MKKYWNAFWMCQSMFCSIPCPIHIWDEEARPYMLLFLPVIGLEMGLLWCLTGLTCRWLNVPSMVSGLVLSLLPYFVIGFIHLDGYMDVTDAVGSYRDLEKRRMILKDSHVGAFAVIGCVILMLTNFAFCSSADGDCGILIFVPVVSRCCSAMAVTCLRSMSTSQYAGAFKAGVSKKQPIILSVMLAMTILLAYITCGNYVLVLLAGLVGYGIALYKGFHGLDGMNGDISGYALTLSELASLGAWALM